MFQLDEYMHLGDELCLSILVLTVVTEVFAAEFAYNNPIRIIINCTRYVCVLRHPKGADFLLLLCSGFFFHFVILVQRIFHQSRCTETASNDRLYTYNILPYQPVCHSRLVTPQRGRLYLAPFTFEASLIIIYMYSLLHQNQRRRK